MLGFIFPGQCCLCCSGRRREPLRRCWQNGNKKIWRAAGGSEHFPEAICMTEWGISRNQFQGCHLNSQSLPYLLYRETSCLGFFLFNKWKYSVNCKNWSPPGGWKMTLSIFRRCRFRICLPLQPRENGDGVPGRDPALPGLSLPTYYSGLHHLAKCLILLHRDNVESYLHFVWAAIWKWERGRLG